MTIIVKIKSYEETKNEIIYKEEGEFETFNVDVIKSSKKIFIEAHGIDGKCFYPYSHEVEVKENTTYIVECESRKRGIVNIYEIVEMKQIN